MTCRKCVFVLLAVLYLVSKQMTVAIAEQSVWYECAPQFGAELQVYSDGQWSDTAQITVGSSIDFRVVKPGTGNDPEDFDTKYVNTWSCVMEPVLTTSLVEDSLTYAVTFGDSSSGSTSTGGSHTYAEPGVYALTCTVDDVAPNSGQNDDPVTLTVLVVVEDADLPLAEPPIVASAVRSISDTGPWYAEPLNVAVGQTVYFRGDVPEHPTYDRDLAADGSLTNDAIALYNWDFGDSTGATGASVSHSFASPGCYMVSLTADDAHNPGTIDDPTSEPSQLLIRVFGAVPAVPTVTEPVSGASCCSLTPTVRWSGQLHDQFLVRIVDTDDPNALPAWDSGEVEAEIDDGSCVGNLQSGEITCATELQEGTTYYAYVRIHNALGWSTWSLAGRSFTVQAGSDPPKNILLSPSSGTFPTGLPGATFTVVYSDACHYTNIHDAELLIDDATLDKVDACYLRYDQDTNRCFLLSDSGSEWLGDDMCTPGSTNVLENDNVRVHLQDTSITPSGSTLSVDWQIEFKKEFAGPKTIALAVTSDKQIPDPDNPEVFGAISVVADSGPTSIITSHASGAYITSLPATIGGTATSTSGISTVEVSTDAGETWSLATGTTTWNHTWSDVTDGIYTLKSRATDCNTPAIVEVPGTGTKVFVDTALPSSTILEPLDGTTIIGDQVVVRGSGFDATSGLDRIEVSFDSGATWLQASGREFFIYEYPVSASGSVTVISRAVDKAGHTGASSEPVTVQVEYQQQMQVLTITASGSGSDTRANLFESQKTMQVGPYSVVNLATGLMLTEIPITGWDSMGNLAIEFSVFHQNMRPGRPDDGTTANWMHSYQSILTRMSSTAVWLYHPDGSEQRWTLGATGWTGDGGNPDTLVELGAGQGYLVTRKDHMKIYYSQQAGPNASSGNVWQTRYIEQPTGHRITLDYGAANLLEWVHDPDGNRKLYVCWQLMGDGRQGLYGVFSCAKAGISPRRYWLQKVNGVLKTIHYPEPEASDRPYVAYEPKDIELAYDCWQMITELRPPDRNPWRYVYDPILRNALVHVADPDNHATNIVYAWYSDPFAGGPPYMVETLVFDPLMRRSCYVHKDYGVMYHGSDEAWKNGRNPWAGMRAYCAVRESATGYLLESFDWDTKHGLLSRYQDPVGNATTYAWDASGNLLTIRAPLNHTTSMTYTASDQLETVTYPAHPGQTPKVKRYTYHPTYYYLTREQIDPDNSNITTEYGYDQYGNKTWVLGPYQSGESPGPQTTYAYDIWHPRWPDHTYPHKVTDPMGRYVLTVTDPLGHELWTTLPSTSPNDRRGKVRTDYDKLGRPFSTWQSGNAQHGDTVATKEYLASGKVKREYDENGYESKYFYDLRGNLKQEEHQKEDANHGVGTFYEYDAVGRLVAASRYPVTYGAAGALHQFVTYEYDAYDQLSKVSIPPYVGRQTEYSYDGNGNLTGSKDANGNLTTSAYDAAGRLTERKYYRGMSTAVSPERKAKYEYYPDGLLRKVYDWTYDWSESTKDWEHSPALPAREFTYDTAGRMTDEICYDLGRRIWYEYTGAGKTKTLQIRDMASSPLSTYSYTYYADNRLETIEDPDAGITHFHYDYRGRLSRKELPNGAYVVYEYDDGIGPSGYTSMKNPLSRLAHYTASNGLVYNVRYSYYKEGNVHTADDGTGVVTYGYDRLYQLLSESRTGDLGYSHAYTYDVYGNRLTKSVAGADTVHYGYNLRNELEEVVVPGQTPIIYEYDYNGNLVTKTQGSAVTEFEYDLDDNLTLVTPPSGPSSSFAYNSAGDRIKKIDSAGSMRFLYSGGSLLQEFDSAGVLKTWYNPGISETQVSGADKLFYHHDRLGSTVTLTTDTGATDNRYVYDAWGNPVYSGGTFDTCYRYVGKAGYYSDPDTGLLKLGARYYDPTIGRFITQDPIRDGLNWYAYAGNSPVNAIDPTGLYDWWGGVRMIGGGLEALAGYGLATTSFAAAGATGGTVIGGIGFGALGVTGCGIGSHGLDTVQAGARQLWTGSNVDSFTSQGLQAAGMSQGWANLTDAGIGFAGSFGAGLGTGAIRASTIAATDPLAEGLRWTQILSKWDTGSKALNAVDYGALGGSATSPLFKAPYINAGVNTLGNPLTTTTLQNVGWSFRLIGTGLTPLGYMGAGIAGAGAQAASTANWRENLR